MKNRFSTPILIVLIAIILASIVAIYSSRKDSATNQSNTDIQADAAKKDTVSENTLPEAQWKKVNLPGEEFVSFMYPEGWKLTSLSSSKNTAVINRGNEKVTIQHISNPKMASVTEEKPIMDNYESSLKGIISRSPIKNGEGHRILVNSNGSEEIHSVFFIGTTLIDVSTASPEVSIYQRVVDSFKYNGF